MPGPKTNEREGTRAVLRYVGVSPYKLRQVIDAIRGKPVEEAADLLRFLERDAAIVVDKLLHSAVANAANNDHLDPEELYVAACFVDEGPTAKRWRPRARGRATRIRKRSSHITIIVSRLPEDRLERLQSRRRAENLAMRQRRVEATRRARTEGAEGAQNRRERRHPETIPVPEEAEEAAGAEEAPEAEEATSAEQALLNEVGEEEAEGEAVGEPGGEAEVEGESEEAAPTAKTASAATKAKAAEEPEPELEGGADEPEAEVAPGAAEAEAEETAAKNAGNSTVAEQSDEDEEKDS
jgi:large subunit ribosomal protein L22